VRIALLGPVELVGDDGAPIELGSRRHRQLLAVLALQAGQVVGTEALIDVIWGESLPADPAATLQTNV
jgi:DNA-binding SARP family transcriptional activator